ncbi:putative invertase inhibitor [Tripterygium wilfordii]|uniref:Putative invertase inhibitor n=2 Tax=Tripterygium wilfordii TaxID=458696 RepID=A0A7J7C691_TRIWF|nr:putative invertase inhibitor [Tripterygium wilfordii]
MADVLEDCRGIYVVMRDDLSNALSDFKSTHDYKKLGGDLIYVPRAPTYCEDWYKEAAGTESPLAKEDKLFLQLALIAIAFTNMAKGT